MLTPHVYVCARAGAASGAVWGVQVGEQDRLQAHGIGSGTHLSLGGRCTARSAAQAPTPAPICSSIMCAAADSKSMQPQSTPVEGFSCDKFQENGKGKREITAAVPQRVLVVGVRGHLGRAVRFASPCFMLAPVRREAPLLLCRSPWRVRRTCA
jgi:hypothetical protein